MTTMDSRAVQRLGPPAMRTFERIADAWKLKPAERRALLGGVPITTYERLRKGSAPQSLSADTLERISHVFGIYKALHILIPNGDYADRWISEPNAALGGATARARMIEGFTGLMYVRQLVDSERGW